MVHTLFNVTLFDMFGSIKVEGKFSGEKFVFLSQKEGGGRGGEDLFFHTKEKLGNIFHSLAKNKGLLFAKPI